MESILKQEPSERFSNELSQLNRYFKNNLFFRQQANLFEEKTIQYLFQHMRYAEYAPEDYVFHYGEEGNLFYIIMEGEVIIKTPAPENIEGEQATPEGFLIYLIEYFDEIQWNRMMDGREVRSIFLKEL